MSCRGFCTYVYMRLYLMKYQIYEWNGIFGKNKNKMMIVQTVI